MTAYRYTCSKSYVPGLDRKPQDPSLRYQQHGRVEPLYERPVFRLRELVFGVGGCLLLLVVVTGWAALS